MDVSHYIKAREVSLWSLHSLISDQLGLDTGFIHANDEVIVCVSSDYKSRFVLGRCMCNIVNEQHCICTPLMQYNNNNKI